MNGFFLGLIFGVAAMLSVGLIMLFAHVVEAFLDELTETDYGDL